MEKKLKLTKKVFNLYAVLVKSQVKEAPSNYREKIETKTILQVRLLLRLAASLVCHTYRFRSLFRINLRFMADTISQF